MLRGLPVFRKIVSERKGKKRTFYSILDMDVKVFENGGFDEELARLVVPEGSPTKEVADTALAASQGRGMTSDTASSSAPEPMNVDSAPGPLTEDSQLRSHPLSRTLSGKASPEASGSDTSKLKLRIRKPQHLIVETGQQSKDVSSLASVMDLNIGKEGSSSDHKAMDVDEPTASTWTSHFVSDVPASKIKDTKPDKADSPSNRRVS